MRLSVSERDTIRDGVRSVAGSGSRVRLFGSRLDDNLRGGDIDLLVELDAPVKSAAVLGASIGAHLQSLLGDRRIDVLIAAPNLSLQPIHRIARDTGVEL